MAQPYSNTFAESLYKRTQTGTPQSSISNPSTAVKHSPVTPISQYPSPLPEVSTDPKNTPTGKWAHPAVAKITKLQSRKAPNETTIRRVLLNTFALFMLYKLSPYIYGSAFLNGLQGENYVNYTMYTLYVLLAYNVFENARRFWWTNSYDDPTLTARQRKLLNLPPSPISGDVSSPAAAITPPRYRKTFTPSPASQSPLVGQAGRRSSLGSYSPTAQPTARTNSTSHLARGSSIYTRSPGVRSVSLLASPAASQASPGSKPIGMVENTRPSTLDLQGSPKWRYMQNGSDPLSASRGRGVY